MTTTDFDNLITAISDVMDVPKNDILRKYCQTTTKARYFLCHLIYHGMPHLRKTLLDNADISRSAYSKYADKADEMIHESKEDLCVMNEIRVKLGLPRLKRSIKHRDKISDTKTLFGFDYSESDIRRERIAKTNAKLYMQKLCSIGRKPMVDGHVFAPKFPRSVKSWYNG